MIVVFVLFDWPPKIGGYLCECVVFFFVDKKSLRHVPPSRSCVPLCWRTFQLLPLPLCRLWLFFSIASCCFVCSDISFLFPLVNSDFFSTGSFFFVFVFLYYYSFFVSIVFLSVLSFCFAFLYMIIFISIYSYIDSHFADFVSLSVESFFFVFVFVVFIDISSLFFFLDFDFFSVVSSFVVVDIDAACSTIHSSPFDNFDLFFWAAVLVRGDTCRFFTILDDSPSTVVLVFRPVPAATIAAIEMTVVVDDVATADEDSSDFPRPRPRSTLQ
mmetsp:Transcript_29759/g.30265  ORF Transcript_29759/g.30265 Transcript_29759/m.30265 type:complete len:271 (+) Transcript_29759:162-974(+)